MLFPYKIIDSALSARSEFAMTEGYQPTHSLFYLNKGNFIIELNGKREEISEGDTLLLPDYIFFRRRVLAPIEFIYIRFAQNPSCPYTFPLPFGKVCPRDRARFLASLGAIERCIEVEGALAAGYSEHLLLDVLFQLHYESEPLVVPTELGSCRDRIAAQALDYITSHIRERILIAELCRAVGTNASTLNFKFRREFGTSVGQLILRERIRLAKRHLISTTYPVSEIARRCGFENVYYFSNTFKKQTGLSPSEYRGRKL